MYLKCLVFVFVVSLDSNAGTPTNAWYSVSLIVEHHICDRLNTQFLETQEMEVLSLLMQ